MRFDDWMTKEQRELVARALSGAYKDGDVALAGSTLGEAERSGEQRLVWLWGQVMQDVVAAYLVEMNRHDGAH